MADNIMNLFIGILTVQLFYAFAITAVTYNLPDDTLDYVTSFSDISEEISLESVGEQVQESVEQQTNIPVVELGALVFYSGNILIDLILNFAFAIPEMIALLITSFSVVFPMAASLAVLVQLFISTMFIVFYFIGIIQLLTGIRSGRLI